jgi:hypothetical protein
VERCRRQQCVDSRESLSLALCVSGKEFPSVGNCRINWQNSAGKAGLQFNFQPSFQLCPPLALR